MFWIFSFLLPSAPVSNTHRHTKYISTPSLLLLPLVYNWNKNCFSGSVWEPCLFPPLSIMHFQANVFTLYDYSTGKKEINILLFPSGGWYVYQQRNEVHNNCGIEIYYQTDMQTTHDNMLLELFCQIISEPCFNTLRTKEQLGEPTDNHVELTVGSIYTTVYIYIYIFLRFLPWPQNN